MSRHQWIWQNPDALCVPVWLRWRTDAHSEDEARLLIKLDALAARAVPLEMAERAIIEEITASSRIEGVCLNEKPLHQALGRLLRQDRVLEANGSVAVRGRRAGWLAPEASHTFTATPEALAGPGDSGKLVQPAASSASGAFS